jgi:hypothetical protein
VDSPWLHKVDRGALAGELEGIRSMAPKMVLSSHLPPAPGHMTERLLASLAAAPGAQPFVGPNQAALEQMLKAHDPVRSSDRHHTIAPDGARGIRKLFFGWVRRQYGGIVPGMFQILAVDLRVAGPVGALYNYLHLRKSSPLSRLQREMLATVVNGKIGGAP